MRGAHRSRGFTLVELLVALFAMSLLAIMSWRGLDGMTRAQALTAARADEVLTLQVGLAQWAADLDALMQLPQIAALEWNGRVLRLTRRGTTSAADGVVVVAWTRRLVDGTGTWLRWQSPPLTSRGQVSDAWLKADIWSQNPGAEEKRLEVAITPLDEWQLFFYRGDAWTNPLSSDATAAGLSRNLTPAPSSAVTGTGTTARSTPTGGAPATPVIPDGVRLVLTLPAGQAISGKLTRDWVRPTVGGGKS